MKIVRDKEVPGNKDTTETAINLSPPEEQIRQFAAVLFSPSDTVEVRAIKEMPDGNNQVRSEWYPAAELAAPAAIQWMTNRNRAGGNVYIGANPRTGRGGKSAADTVPGCSVLFCDIDNAPSFDDARRRIYESGLPAPSMVVRSGRVGGLHAYWRLELAVSHAEFTRLQGVLIGVLDSDRIITDPPRIMRVPGLLNVKCSPQAMCVLEYANADSWYDHTAFLVQVDSVAATVVRAKPAGGTITEGQRHFSLNSYTASQSAIGMVGDELRRKVHRYNQQECNPPKPPHEIEKLCAYYELKDAKKVPDTQPDEEPDSEELTAGPVPAAPAPAPAPEPEPPRDAVADAEAVAAALVIPEPVPINELVGSPSPDWLIGPGLVARGATTLLTALWKCGKTTLIVEWLRGTCGYRLPGFEVKPCKVLVATEESSQLWIGRRNQHRLSSTISMCVRPFHGRPDSGEWRRWVDAVGGWVERDKYDLLVVDTWGGMSPAESENDAAMVLSALSPLMQLSEQLGVLLVHHPVKGDATQGQASRGSGALPAAVDVILEMRRFKADDPTDTFRKLTAYSRFDETPDTLTIDYQPDGYHLLDGNVTPAGQDRKERLNRILAIIGDGPPEGLSRSEIADQVGVARTDRTLRQDITDGVSEHRWKKAGAGTSFRYQRWGQ